MTPAEAWSLVTPIQAEALWATAVAWEKDVDELILELLPLLAGQDEAPGPHQIEILYPPTMQ